MPQFPSFKNPASTQGLRNIIAELTRENEALKESVRVAQTASPSGKLVEENGRLKTRLAAFEKAAEELIAGLPSAEEVAKWYAADAELHKQIREEQAEWERGQSELKAAFARAGIPWELRR